MITLKPGDEAKATDAIEHLVNRGRQRAMYQLMGTGIKYLRRLRRSPRRS